MAECEPHNMYLNLGENTWSEKQFRLNDVRSILLIFKYFIKLLIVLSVATGSISIALFATVIEASVIEASKLSPGFVKIFLKIRNKKKKPNKIVMLTTSISNSTESKLFEALINKGVSHEEFMTILNE